MIFVKNWPLFTNSGIHTRSKLCYVHSRPRPRRWRHWSDTGACSANTNAMFLSKVNVVVEWGNSPEWQHIAPQKLYFVMFQTFMINFAETFFTIGHPLGRHKFDVTPASGIWNICGCIDGYYIELIFAIYKFIYFISAFGWLSISDISDVIMKHTIYLICKKK